MRTSFNYATRQTWNNRWPTHFALIDSMNRGTTTMLVAEHEAAEILRCMRLKAYGMHRRGGYGFRWLLALLGRRAQDRSRAAFRSKGS